MPNAHEIFWSNYRVMRRHLRDAEDKAGAVTALRVFKYGPIGPIIWAASELQKASGVRR